MGYEMQSFWSELATDLNTPAFYWQLAVIMLSLGAARVLNILMRRHVMNRAPESWKPGIGGAERLLFPLSSLALVSIGSLLMRNAGLHTSLLSLSSTLLMAMAVIRLVVYSLRYVFAPSLWLKTAENAIVTSVWLLVALDLVGVLPDLVTALDAVRFNVGKNQLSLWMMLQAAFMVVVTIVIALSISRFLENKLMRAEQIDINLRVVISKLLRVVLALAGVLIALSAIGFDITLLSVFGGALGVGLGFGLQKIASNYVSGFILLLDDSIHLGDVVTVEQEYGIVSKIQSRYLILKKLDGTEVVIPNETLIATSYVNHTYTERKTLIFLPVQVSYRTDLEQGLVLMVEAARQVPRVLPDPPPAAIVLGFGESGIDLRLSVWIEDPEEGSMNLKSEIYLAMWKLFQAGGISIPFPQREVRILGDAPPADRTRE
ncbi:MAG: mechanosensitive ion channel [Methylobacterium sp.]|nr:mechanosensitive ion channel [Methylobacterium sp.]